MVQIEQETGKSFQETDFFLAGVARLFAALEINMLFSY